VDAAVSRIACCSQMWHPSGPGTFNSLFLHQLIWRQWRFAAKPLFRAQKTVGLRLFARTHRNTLVPVSLMPEGRSWPPSVERPERETRSWNEPCCPALRWHPECLISAAITISFFYPERWTQRAPNREQPWLLRKLPLLLLLLEPSSSHLQQPSRRISTATFAWTCCWTQS
jgi:hypothetical protein